MNGSQKVQQLIRLQDMDDEIAEHKKRLAEIPVQLDACRLELEAKKEILSIAKEKIAALQKNSKAIESEVQRENDHMAKAKTKLAAVKTNKEYTAILSEVDAVKEKVEGLEDEELEIMESLEEKQKEIPGVEKDCKEEDARFQEYKEKKDAERDRTREELDGFIAGRKKLVEQVDKVMLQRYEKVANSREGRAVVLLRGNICQGCFQQILPQMVIDVKVGESIQQCSNCIRFLYWDEKTDSNDFLKKEIPKLKTEKISGFCSPIQDLLTKIENKLKSEFGSQCVVKRHKGSTSIEFSVSSGKVWAKLIPQGDLGECIMIGVSTKISDQNWGSYKFSECRRVGGGNYQPFYFMDLPQDHQTAIDDSIKIIKMLLEKLKIQL